MVILQAVKILNSKGYFKEYAYDAVGNVTVITDAVRRVYEDPKGGLPKFVISEAKYGTSLMSDKWIVVRLEEAVGAKKAKEIILEMTLNPDNVHTTLRNHKELKMAIMLL